MNPKSQLSARKFFQDYNILLGTLMFSISALYSSAAENLPRAESLGCETEEAIVLPGEPSNQVRPESYGAPFDDRATQIGPLRDEALTQNPRFAHDLKCLIIRSQYLSPRFRFGEPLGQQLNYLHWERVEEAKDYAQPVSNAYLSIPDIRASHPRQFDADKKAREAQQLHPHLPLLISE